MLFRSIKVDCKFPVADASKTYGVIINIVDNLGAKVLKKQLASFSQSGFYDTLTFATPFENDYVEEGCLVSFGLYGYETFDTICLGKKENGDGTYNLTLVPYDDAIYTADTYSVHDFNPKATPPNDSVIPINFGDRTVEEDNELRDAVTPKYVNIVAQSGFNFHNRQPSSLIITASTYGFNPTSYQWAKEVNGSFVNISGATSASFSVSSTDSNTGGVGNYRVTVDGYTAYATITDMEDGGYQDYQFAVGAFGLTDEQARALTWYDEPPATTAQAPCLYMATKWIGA